jgi:hypothetical protein
VAGKAWDDRVRPCVRASAPSDRTASLISFVPPGHTRLLHFGMKGALANELLGEFIAHHLRAMRLLSSGQERVHVLLETNQSYLAGTFAPYLEIQQVDRSHVAPIHCTLQYPVAPYTTLE